MANRHFDGRRPMVMKVLADSFIDRNGKPKEVYVVCFQPRAKFAYTQAIRGLEE